MPAVTYVKDGTHNWGGFAHIESLVVYWSGAHFTNILDPPLEKYRKIGWWCTMLVDGAQCSPVLTRWCTT